MSHHTSLETAGLAGEDAAGGFIERLPPGSNPQRLGDEAILKPRTEFELLIMILIYCEITLNT